MLVNRKWKTNMIEHKILKSQILTPNQIRIKLEDLAYRRRMPKIISWGDLKESQFKIRWEILTHNRAKGYPIAKRNKTITAIIDTIYKES